MWTVCKRELYSWISHSLCNDGSIAVYIKQKKRSFLQMPLYQGVIISTAGSHLSDASSKIRAICSSRLNAMMIQQGPSFLSVIKRPSKSYYVNKGNQQSIDPRFLHWIRRELQPSENSNPSCSTQEPLHPCINIHTFLIIASKCSYSLVASLFFFT